jgi:hypothetical protein
MQGVPSSLQDERPLLCEQSANICLSRSVLPITDAQACRSGGLVRRPVPPVAQDSPDRGGTVRQDAHCPLSYCTRQRALCQNGN